MEFYDGLTKKQIFDHFIEKFINTKLKRQEPFIVENFVASDTKEIIKLNRYHWSCEIKITNGDFQYQKLYYDGGDIVKAHRKNGRFSSVIGPAIMYKEEGELGSLVKYLAHSNCSIISGSHGNDNTEDLMHPVPDP